MYFLRLLGLLPGLTPNTTTHELRHCQFRRGNPNMAKVLLTGKAIVGYIYM